MFAGIKPRPEGFSRQRQFQNSPCTFLSYLQCPRELIAMVHELTGNHMHQTNTGTNTIGTGTADQGIEQRACRQK
jgi:hypothetical protein